MGETWRKSQLPQVLPRPQTSLSFSEPPFDIPKNVIHPASVKAIRANAAVRGLVVILTILGWVVLSNHCALSLMVNRVDATEHSCCQKTAPKNQQDQVPMECCKTLSAVVADAGTVNVPPIWPMFLTFAETLFIFVSASEEPVAPTPSPPERTVSLPELILQQSLLSHAPPALS